MHGKFVIVFLEIYTTYNILNIYMYHNIPAYVAAFGGVAEKTKNYT